MTAAHELLKRLHERSGFAHTTLNLERLLAHLHLRATELKLIDMAVLAERALRDEAEYARLEAAFSPPETWLFRYRESCEFLRVFAQSASRGTVRVLIIGAGGWCEPVSIAAALLAGAPGRRIDVLATDRNPELFDDGAVFSGMQLRGEIPAWASACFVEAPFGMRATREVIACIRTRVAEASTVIEMESLIHSEFDLVVFRNVAIYLDESVRARIFEGLVRLLAPSGVLLVGHAEVHAAIAATGLVSHTNLEAFALVRPTATVTRALPSPHAEPVLSLPFVLPPRESDPSPSLDAASTASGSALLDPLEHVARALQHEGDGDSTSAFAAISRALYLDPMCEAALVVAARLSSVRGAAADAQRFRMRALHAHLEAMRTNDGEGSEK